MRKLNVSVIVGVLVAVMGAGVVVAYGQSVDNKVAGGKNPVAVLVADSDLEPGMPADEVAANVHLEQVPEAYVAEGALHSTDGLSAMPEGTVLSGPVARGSQLTGRSFADAAVAGHVRPSDGHVAIAVQTDLSPGVARYLSVGSSVDVFATYRDVRDTSGDLSVASSRTKLFVSDVRVLAVSVAEVNDDTKTDNGALVDKVVVLLDLKPSDAEKLVNATTLGQIYLAETASGHSTPKGAVPSDVVKSNS
jgi:Flp pilus assembly protein CpaB